MKRKRFAKNRNNRAFNVSVGLTVAMCIVNFVFIVMLLLINRREDVAVPESVDVVLFLNMAILIIVLLVHRSFYKRLRSKVVQPVELVQAELNKLISGEFETPISAESDDGMEEIYASLEEIRKKLEAFSLKQEEIRETRNTYVSGLMHDIATPITRISGCASMICDGMVTSPQDIKKFAKIIVQNTEDVDIMLKNLAEIEKYDKAYINSNCLPIDMSYIIEHYVNSLKLELAGKDVKISFVNLCENAPVCKIDVKSCKRVLMNLINNSIRYRKKDVPCEIVITLQNGRPGELLFSLADNGIGIQEGTEKKIFELFYRADSSRHNPDEGNGIGLFISSEIMKANNAAMWAKNNGNGLTVFVAIPLVDEQAVDWFEF